MVVVLDGRECGVLKMVMCYDGIDKIWMEWIRVCSCIVLGMDVSKVSLRIVLFWEFCVYWLVLVVEVYINVLIWIEKFMFLSSLFCGCFVWWLVRCWICVILLLYCVRWKENSFGLGLVIGCLYCIIVDFVGICGR